MSFWDEVAWTVEDVGKIVVDPFGLWVNDTNGAPVLSTDDVKDIITLPVTAVKGFKDITNNVVDTVHDVANNVIDTAGDTVTGLGSTFSTPLLIIGLAFVFLQSQK